LCSRNTIFTHFTFEKKLIRFAHSNIFSHPVDRFVRSIFHTLHTKRREKTKFFFMPNDRIGEVE